MLERCVMCSVCYRTAIVLHEVRKVCVKIPSKYCKKRASFIEVIPSEEDPDVRAGLLMKGWGWGWGCGVPDGPPWSG